MAVVPIYNSFHPVLKKKTKDIEEINDEVVQLVNNLYDTMYNISNGVGLAANQIGDLNSALVIDTSVGTKNTPQPVTMINPEILESSEEIESMDEGCLSVPEFFEKVERPETIKVRYYDLDMHEYVREIGGFLARVMQHEIDHLRGVLFYERISPLKRALAKSKLKRIQRGEVQPDYPMIQADGTQTGEIIETR